MPTSTLLLVAREQNKMAEKKTYSLTVLQITLSASQSSTLAIRKSKILYRKVRNKLLICSVTLFALCLTWKTKYIYTTMLCAVSCKILSAGTDLLTSDSYFSRVNPSQFSGAVFFPKQKW